MKVVANAMEGREAIQQRLEAIEELPSLPAIIAEINDLLSNPKASAKQLATIIMKDPAITAKVLKIANSAFFGFAKAITSVNQAIVALGFNTVRSIVLCTSVIDAFSSSRSQHATFDRKQFWAFSAGVGAAARVVARQAQLKKRENALVTGLLHGVGKLVMDEFFHDEFIQMIELAEKEQLSWWDAEVEVFGVTDAEFSGCLLKHWKLGDDLIYPVMCQENPLEAPEEHRLMSCITLTGNVIARVTGIGNPGDVPLPLITQDVLNTVNITGSEWARLFELTVDEATKAAVFFDA